MPFTTNPPTESYNPEYDLPQHLAHKPMYALPYQSFEGPDSDVQFMSVGLAQYNTEQVSVKMMRHTGVKWTRQAEELPLTRAVDMTLFVAKAVCDADPATGMVTIPPKTMGEDQESAISIMPETRTWGERESYIRAIGGEQASLKVRLRTLRDVLNELEAKGNL